MIMDLHPLTFCIEALLPGLHTSTNVIVPRANILVLYLHSVSVLSLCYMQCLIPELYSEPEIFQMRHID